MVDLDLCARVGFASDETDGVAPLSHSMAARREGVWTGVRKHGRARCCEEHQCRSVRVLKAVGLPEGGQSCRTAEAEESSA